MQNIDQASSVSFDFFEDLMINAIAKVLISNGARALRRSVHSPLEFSGPANGRIFVEDRYVEYYRDSTIWNRFNFVYCKTASKHKIYTQTTFAGHRQLSTEYISASAPTLKCNTTRFRTKAENYSTPLKQNLSPGQIDFVGCILHLYDRITFNTKL